MLLDSFKELFDYIAAFVQSGTGQGWQACVVGQEDKGLSGLGIFEKDTLPVIGLVLGSVVSVQRNGLIADDASCTVYFVREKCA